VTGLAFLRADAGSPRWRSPLSDAGLPEGIRDVSAEAAEETAAIAPAAGVAGLELDGPHAEQVVRRLSDVDLDRLPAVAPVARVRTRVEQLASGRFRLWFPQEYADHVAAAVVDAWEGLA
jgi:hypothetical protein